MELVNDANVASAYDALPSAQDHPDPPGFLADLGQFGADMASGLSRQGPGYGGTGQTFRAALRKTIENDLPFGISDDYVRAQQMDPVIEALNKDKAPGDPGWLVNPYRDTPQGVTTDMPQAMPGDDRADRILSLAAELKRANPGLAGNIPTSRADFEADVQAEQRASLNYERNLSQHGGAFTGTLADFAGQAVGGMADPVNIAASVAGFPASESLLKTFLVEGAYNASADLATLPSRAAHYADIGEPMSAGDMAAEVGGAGLIGGGLGVGGKLIGRLLGLKGHELVDEFHDTMPDAPPAARAAANMVEDEADRAVSNPFEDTPEGLDLHRRAIMDAQAALDARQGHLAPDFSKQLRAGDDAPVAGDVFYSPAQAAAEVEQAIHTPRTDPESLKQFNDPVRKPEAFHQQADDIAGEIAPAPVNSQSVLMNASEFGLGFAEASRNLEAKGLQPIHKLIMDGENPVGGVIGHFDPSTGELRIESVNAATGAGSLGPTKIRSVVDALKEEFPAATKITGLRTSGARPEKAEAGVLLRDAASGAAAEGDRGGAPAERQELKPFGPAQAQIEALQRLPGEELTVDPATGDLRTVADVRADAERHARAVERLRSCVEGEGE